jgi:hypothetical protein
MRKKPSKKQKLAGMLRNCAASISRSLIDHSAILAATICQIGVRDEPALQSIAAPDEC